MAPSVQTFINSFNNKLEEPVRQHLKNVYGCLTVATMVSAVGASVHLFTDSLQDGFISGIGAIIFFILLMATSDDEGKKLSQRVCYLLGFAGLTGLGMGPLLEHAIMVEPSIIVTALVGTSVVFVSFTICAMLAERGKWLYLMTVLNTMLIMPLGNLFFGSSLIFQAHLYVGLIVMCGFVLYDTQLIIEKRRMGSKDVVTHALDLFVDFIGLFRRLVIILTQKEV